ncbi:MAG: cAMP dependent protein kinase [Gaeavirus sp.]|uniref:cAMP dependent protein kinase n=1 Tax=Gaeavirus sp. TaxID=2487767 RepID=A0A3G5A405_9VIRU|nr:MAG: cAMP dependent protein kinase [Gaeavirus sp.]
MINTKINLLNYANGSFGNIFTDQQNNIYKVTYISENDDTTNDYINNSNINEIIYLNMFNDIPDISTTNIINNSPDSTTNNSEEAIKSTDITITITIDNQINISTNMKMNTQEYSLIHNDKIIVQSITTNFYNLQNLKKFFNINDHKLSKKYEEYLNNNYYRHLIFSKLKMYDTNLDKYIYNNRAKVIDNFDSIAKRILISLATLHHNGLIHGDLKPQNILINNINDLSLTDFGAVKLVNLQKYQLSCTLCSRCPEDLSHDTTPKSIYKNSNFSSDIWSLGLIFAQMIIGFNPVLQWYYDYRTQTTSDTIIEYKIDSKFKSIDFIDIHTYSHRSVTLKTKLTDELMRKMDVINDMLIINPQHRLSSIEDVYLSLFHEAFPYDFRITYNYNYIDAANQEITQKLFTVRHKHYPLFISICNNAHLTFIIPLLFDILDRMFIKLIQTDTTDFNTTPDRKIKLLFGSILIIALGYMNQKYITYNKIFSYLTLDHNTDNIKQINAYVIRIINFLNFDIFRPFNIYYCSSMLSSKHCNSTNESDLTDLYGIKCTIIHNIEDKHKLITILNTIIGDDILNISPEYYYDKLRN